MGFCVSTRLSSLLLTFWSLAAWAASPESTFPPSRVRTRNVTLSMAAEPVHISTAIPTTLTFDTPVNGREAVLNDTTLVEILAVGERSLTLRALAELRKPVTLRVPLSGASSRVAPVFKLTTATDVVDAQVLVFRDASGPELLRARLAELEARCAACEAALAEQRERGASKGPADWVLSRQVDTRGVKVARLHAPRQDSAVSIAVYDAARFLAKTWVVFQAQVANDTSQPWRPGRAWLEDAVTGQRVAARAVRFAPAAPLHGDAGRVVVEFGWTAGNSSGTYRLVVEAASGGVPLVIPDMALQDGTPAGE
ncbi:DUF2381 family protein [Myxococcus sp. SDU36]|uniref:DUF2381 family protein n=1 Tax=Myxococcus sp. SDU36 TaxID=2831967 RepID=UPI0025438E92|nr:DUF2381 family protein [Myxococcus sp. SDU36]WIG93225.1 DUF2381 family protein [Myxococcus sp. SDU36]